MLLTRRAALIAAAGAIPCFRTLAAVRGDSVLYMGGTIPGLEPKTDGKFDLSGDKVLIFSWKKGQVQVPYEKITSLEYGQKVGRRVGVAIAINIFALFSKKRKHYLTLGYEDAAGKKQGAVFELAKGTVRSTLMTLETRSGQKVEYESEEARKNVGA